MPTYADALKALEAVEGGAELVAAVKGEVTVLRKEAGNYRTRAKTLADHIGVDLSTDDLEGSLAALKDKPASKNSKNDPETDARFKRLENELSAERTKRETAESQARTQKAQAAIRSELDGKVLGVDDATRMLMIDAKFREDGSAYFVDGSGAELSVKEYASAWIKDRPHFAVSKQPQGPGGNGNRGPAAGVEQITRSYYRENKSNPALMEKITKGTAVIVDG